MHGCCRLPCAALIETPGDEGKVVSVVQKGYTLGERVVRPAMVVVGNGAPEGEAGGTEIGRQQTHKC